MGSRIPLVFSLIALACVHTRGPAGPLQSWNDRYPEAARGLCGWVHQHPDAAKKLFKWDREHPDRSQEFVQWALSSRGTGIDDFVSSHPYWRGFGWMAENHRPALVLFVQWCRLYPDAAEDLISHPQSLFWAGNHLAC
jgi:hypothetical protein